MASDRSPSVPPNLHAGIVVAQKYTLTRKLGAGAMGEVWAARHATLGEEVAVKLVRRAIDHQDGSSSDTRFLLEARVAATLAKKTRHIVNVTDHGEDGALAYLVMELAVGESLDDRLAREGPMSLGAAREVIGQLARGLAVAHAEGVVHRDLKPSNVFVTTTEEGRPLLKILDFGIAKLRPRGALLSGAAKHSTLRGFLLGTPAYMSPEQVRGLSVDHRADVWALGVIAFHLLTGELPFGGEAAEALFDSILRGERRSVRAYTQAFGPVVDDFFARCFAPRLEQRFASVAAFAGAFEQLERLASTPAAEDDEHVPLVLSKRPPMVSLPPHRPRHVERAVVVLGVFVAALTALALSLHFEGEPSARAPARAEPIPSTSVVTAAIVLPVSAPAEGATTSIPAPPPAPTAAMHTSQRARASLLGAAAPPLVAAPPPPRKNRPVDKSDVF